MFSLFKSLLFSILYDSLPLTSLPFRHQFVIIALVIDLARQDGKEVEGVGSRQSCARDDEVDSLRIRFQRLEGSLQEKKDTIEVLRGVQYPQIGRAHV